MDNKSPHIVVVGAGFGGLNFCKEFTYPSAHITLVDRQNHHLFQPLLYQVATAALAAPDIAQPIRSILADKPNLTVLLGEVVDFDLPGKKVFLAKNTLSYDYLVLALGGVTSYFGHPEWEQYAPGLKTIDDAFRIRRDILLAFERAESEPDRERHQQLMTITVVGGGPTGVELAGAFAELARHVLTKDFRRINPAKARVVLVEAGPRLLPMLSEALSASAKEQLERLGVEVRLSARVKSITRNRVAFESGEKLAAENIVWAAGVSAVPLTKKLGAELDRAGRVKVNPDLSLPRHPEAFAIGDMALVIDARGRPAPGVAPAATQMARHVARILREELMYPSLHYRPEFTYRDKGTMATIGRSAAVAQVGRLEISGFPAWLAWLFVHLIFLIGLRNKISVLISWAYAYFAYKRGARIITGMRAEGNEER